MLGGGVDGVGDGDGAGGYAGLVVAVCNLDVWVVVDFHNRVFVDYFDLLAINFYCAVFIKAFYSCYPALLGCDCDWVCEVTTTC